MVRGKLLLLAILIFQNAYSADLTLNMGFPKGSIQAQFQMEIATEAFSRIDRTVDFIQVEAERALVNANDGIEDGNLIRIKGLEMSYPNLRRVPEKVVDYDFVAFSLDGEVNLKNWHSLKGKDVGIVRGWKILENNLGEIANLLYVRNGMMLMPLLEQRRAEFVIYERWQGLALIKSGRLTNIHLLEPPLASREMFIYLHKTHQSLIPELADAIRAMRKDGTYQQIFDRIFRALEK